MASLPALPKGHDFEDLIAGCFQCAGYFVEKRIQYDDEGRNIFELDGVATLVHNGFVDQRIIEAKSGKYRFEDALKTLGQMVVTNTARGHFFVSRQRDSAPLDAIEKLCGPHSLSSHCCADVDSAIALFGKGNLPALLTTGDFCDLFRWSFLIERSLFREVSDYRKTKTEGSKALAAYARVVNNELFFQDSALSRLHHVYSNYSAVPALARSLAHELNGNQFDPKNKDRAPLLDKAMRTDDYGPIQVAMYLEHRSRLAILLAAIELLASGKDPARSPEGKWRWNYLYLPASLKTGLSWLKSQPNFERFAHLWQVYIMALGGFTVLEKRNDEYKLLGQLSGLTETEVEVGLNALDEVFAISGGRTWMRPILSDKLSVCLFVPPSIRGVGVLIRQVMYESTTLRQITGDRSSAFVLQQWYNAFFNRATKELARDGNP